MEIRRPYLYLLCLPVLELGNANANTYLVTSYLMEENALGINDVNVVCVLFTLHCLCRGVVAREYREGHSDQKGVRNTINLDQH